MKWSSQHVTWCQFDAIKHFKWNWSCPLLFCLCGDNQLCHCSPLCIPSKIWAVSRHCWLGLALPWEERKGQAFCIIFRPKWVWIWLQSHCRRGEWQDQRIGLWWLRYIPWESPCWHHHHLPHTSQQVLLPVGKQSCQRFAHYLLFLGETPSEGGVGGCSQMSEVRPFPCTKLYTVQAIGRPSRCHPWGRSSHHLWGWTFLFALEVWPLLRSTVMPLACVGLYCLSKARASVESNHLCTFLEALGYHKAVAETPRSSPSECRRVRRGSSGAKSQGV